MTSHKKTGKYNLGQWAFGIPTYDISDQFIYFNDLMNTENNSPIVANRKINLARAVSNEITSFINSINDPVNNSIETALAFIKIVAENERKNEVACLRANKKFLQGKLPRNKNVDQVLNRLDNLNLNDPNALEYFYAQLTECLTVLRNKGLEYQDRLEKIVQHFDKKMHKLAEEDARFRQAGDVRAMLANLIGIANKKQKDAETAFAARLRKIVTSYTLSQDVRKKCTSGAQYAAIVAAITVDIENELEKQMKIFNYTDFTQFSQQQLNAFLTEYEKREKTEQTHLQKALEEGGYELDEIMQAGIDVLGIRTVDKNLQKKRLQQVAQLTNKKTAQTQNELYKRLKEDKTNNKLIKDLSLLTFSRRTSGDAGNMAEFAQIVFSGGRKVSGTAATDTLGYIEITTKRTDVNAKISDYINKISQVITNYSKQQTTTRKESNQMAHEEMNRQIKELEEQLKKELQQIEEINFNDFFIFHESIKLYKTMETKSRNVGFHGRELTILNYIDELYTVNGLSDLVLPQKDALEMIALNLSNEAIGGQYKEDIQKFLSIFAGMLMFDDIQNMAYRAVEALTNQNQTSGQIIPIHLYKLNDIFVPASMILTYTYESMMQAYELAATGYAAKAEIHTGKIDEEIKKFLEEHEYTKGSNVHVPYEQYWPEMGEESASNTKIRIALFAAFTDFIQNKLMKI